MEQKTIKKMKATGVVLVIAGGLLSIGNVIYWRTIAKEKDDRKKKLIMETGLVITSIGVILNGVSFFNERKQLNQVQKAS